ncbi:MAG: AhpC/TSA family protein [Bacteroidales bacterium]|nr:AhpC/TSA family protein [Bacteroidales bacterium]
MKKFLSIFVMMAMMVASWSQKVELNGTVTGLPNGVRLTLAEAVGSKLVVRDTLAIAANGKFKTTLNVASPTLFTLQPQVEKAPQVHLMAMPGDKALTLNLAYDQQHNFMRVVSSKGSRNAELYQKFNAALYNSLQDFDRINGEFGKPETSDERKQELQQEAQGVQVRQKMAVKEAISAYSDCLMSAFLVTYFDNDFSTYCDLYEEVLGKLGSKYPDDQFVANISHMVATSMKEGSLAPEIEMRDKDGNIRKLSDLRGKVVLIDFWASWCGPCRAELPNVVRLYNKYHDKGFDIYSVSLDKDRNAWLQAIQNTGQVWPNHVSDLQGWTSSGGRTYGVSSIPHTVLIDRKGRIIGKKLRGEELASKLKEIFGE